MPFELPTFYGRQLPPETIASNAETLQNNGFEFISYPLVPLEIDQEFGSVVENARTLFIGQLPYELRQDLVPWMIDSIFHTTQSVLVDYYRSVPKGCHARVQLSGEPNGQPDLLRLRVITDLAGIWIHDSWPAELATPMKPLTIEPARHNLKSSPRYVRFA